jgi:acetyl esterase/lipase
MKILITNILLLLITGFLTPDIPVINNIVYGEAVNDKNINQTLLMDMYRTERTPATKKPTIIFVHGGGFRGGDKQQAMYIKMCRAFAEAGYVAFSVNYRLSTYGKITLPVLNNARSDVLTAFRWIRAHSDEYGIDPEKMLIAGDSAGGGIVVNTAYCDEGKAMIAGCIDLWGGLPFSHSEPEIDKYGQPVHYDPITANVPPTCIFHSKGDDIVPVSSSINLAYELKEKGIVHELHLLESADHYPENMADEFIPVMIAFANQIISKI